MPEQVDIPALGVRRVKGLRREEVASRAGVSVDYYRRLERGGVAGASDSVLEALAGALMLGDAERAHLFDLARAVAPVAPRPARRSRSQARPIVLRTLDAIVAPAVLCNRRSDLIATNQLGRALLAPIFDSRERPANPARFLFLDPAASEFYVDWDGSARDVVAGLRSAATHNPYDQGLSELVGELATRSLQFRQWWAAHDVRRHRAGSKTLRHPLVGDMTLDYEMLDVAADDGLTIVIYGAEAGSRSAQALDLLASWVATPTSSQVHLNPDVGPDSSPADERL